VAANALVHHWRCAGEWCGGKLQRANMSLVKSAHCHGRSGLSSNRSSHSAHLSLPPKWHLSRFIPLVVGLRYIFYPHRSAMFTIGWAVTERTNGSWNTEYYLPCGQDIHGHLTQLHTWGAFISLIWLHLNWVHCKATQFTVAATSQNKVVHAAFLIGCSHGKLGSFMVYRWNEVW